MAFVRIARQDLDSQTNAATNVSSKIVLIATASPSSAEPAKVIIFMIKICRNATDVILVVSSASAKVCVSSADLFFIKKRVMLTRGDAS